MSARRILERLRPLARLIPQSWINDARAQMIHPLKTRHFCAILTTCCNVPRARAFTSIRFLTPAIVV
jgi:hypothetical protein